MDETGPVISSFNITDGQVITAPITITASATDSESSMDRLDLYIDGTLVGTVPDLRTEQSGVVESGLSPTFSGMERTEKLR